MGKSVPQNGQVPWSGCVKANSYITVFFYMTSFPETHLSRLREGYQRAAGHIQTQPGDDEPILDAVRPNLCLKSPQNFR